MFVETFAVEPSLYHYSLPSASIHPQSQELAHQPCIQ